MRSSVGNKYAIIIPCRTGSTRFPCKILLPYYSQTHNILGAADLIKIRNYENIILAISNIDKNKIHNQYPIRRCYGPENDVIGRVLYAAIHYSVENIIDITSDCPLIGADLIRWCIDKYESSGADYFSNVLPVRKDPDGFDVQIYKTELLQRAYDDIDCIHEHVGWNISNLYRHKINICNEGHGIAVDKCLTLDEPADYFEIQRCIDEVGIGATHLEIVNWLDKQEHMWNKDVKRKSV